MRCWPLLGARLTLTETTLQKLPIRENGQKLQEDNSLPEFATRVSEIFTEYPIPQS